MNTLIIVGAGGHGKVIADAAHCAGWSEIIFYDDAYPNIRTVGAWKIQGTFEDLLQTRSHTPVVVGIGHNVTRLEKAQQLKEYGFQLTAIIHPKAIISPSASIGVGTVIFAGAVINPDAIIEEQCIINTNATIEHDCHIQTGVHISPGATLGGGVTVGALSWIGIGANIKHCVTIGNSVIVGAGAAVVKDLPDDCTAIGVPANVVKYA